MGAERTDGERCVRCPARMGVGFCAVGRDLCAEIAVFFCLTAGAGARLGAGAGRFACGDGFALGAWLFWAALADLAFAASLRFSAAIRCFSVCLFVSDARLTALMTAFFCSLVKRAV